MNRIYRIPQALALLLGLAFLYGGVIAARQLADACVPTQTYATTRGEIIEVVGHTQPDEGITWQLAEIGFRYSVGDRQLRTDTLTPLCRQCDPEEVVRALGMRPSQLAAGMQVPVFVLRSDPRTAYLALADRSELGRQLVVVLVLLIVLPAFAAWQFRAWGKAARGSRR